MPTTKQGHLQENEDEIQQAEIDQENVDSKMC